MNKHSFFKQILVNIYKTTVLPIVKKVNTRASQQIPKVELRDEHLQHAKLIPSRKELLELLPKDGVVAELGVDKGDFSQLILSINKPKKLHLVDFWGSKRYNQDKRRKVEQMFKEQIENNKVEINLGLSTVVESSFDNEYFDWIYIDTDHSYATTIQELKLYAPKIKKGGIIAGHDYILGNWNGLVRYGVIEAVHQFCVENNWEIIYLTTELHNPPSFAIRRIADA